MGKQFWWNFSLRGIQANLNRRKFFHLYYTNILRSEDLTSYSVKNISYIYTYIECGKKVQAFISSFSSP
jgi:hypothetical protein